MRSVGTYDPALGETCAGSCRPGLRTPTCGAALARLIAAYAPHDDGFRLRIPGLEVSRDARTNALPVHQLHWQSLCVVAQGAKALTVSQGPP